MIGNPLSQPRRSTSWLNYSSGRAALPLSLPLSPSAKESRKGGHAGQDSLDCQIPFCDYVPHHSHGRHDAPQYILAGADRMTARHTISAASLLVPLSINV